MARRAICISHATGAEGSAVGRAVGERLGFRYVDEEVISQAAESADLDPTLIADAERRKPFVARLLGHLGDQGGAPRLPTGEATRALPSDADLRALITSVLRSFATEGSVVIVAHAASYALAGGDVLRVLVTASPEIRAKRVAAARGIDERAGARAIKDEDAARADYLKRFYAVERELPTHYDVVVNTDKVEPDAAAEIVAAAS